MQFEFKPSFERSLKSLSQLQRTKAKRTADKIIHFYTTGEGTPGLGISHLRGNFWEARSVIKERLLYRWEGDWIEFVLAGNHEDVKRFLKHQT